MLILSRRVGESLMIGDNVQIKLLRIDGNQVKFGIHADEHIPIHRLEIWQKVQQEKEKNGNK
jgi:carbon storage regulator